MRYLRLSNGMKCRLDDEDYERYSGQKWSADGPRCASQSYYAVGTIDGKTVYLHRVVMGSPKGVRIDHIDTDTLNNTKKNLRHSDAMRNGRNRKAKPGRTIGVIFVSSRPNNPWSARIQVMYRTINLGRFKTKREAVRARRAGEAKYFSD